MLENYENKLIYSKSHEIILSEFLRSHKTLVGGLTAVFYDLEYACTEFSGRGWDH